MPRLEAIMQTEKTRKSFAPTQSSAVTGNGRVPKVKPTKNVLSIMHATNVLHGARVSKVRIKKPGLRLKTGMLHI